MDNYYGDKYNLDNYYTAPKPEKRSNSGKKRSNGSRYKKATNKRTQKTSERGNRTTQSKREGNSKNTSKSKKIYAVWAAVLLLVLGVTVGIVALGNQDDTFRFSKNISLSGIDISNLTYKEAKAKVEENAQSTVEKFTLNITAGGFSKKLTKKDFSYNFKINEALNEAKTYSLKEQGKYEGATDTEFTELENPDFELNYTVTNESIVDNVTYFAKKVNKDYKNARVKKFIPFASERFVYQEAENGYELVQADLTEKISEFFTSGKKQVDITAQVNVYEPSITVSDLKANIVGLSKAVSVSYNTANGNTNMRVALEACNGSVIEPGELWSFNDCTGDSNLEENGYKPATVISGQELTEGIGGGLCQASTTIFKAAIFANMAIYERHNHFWASSYAYPGEDATIDYPNLDLKLRNTTEYQMFMECRMEGTTLTVNIYGYQDPSYDNIKIYSKNYDISKGKSYKTITYRILYLNNEIVKEEVLCYSTYSLKDGVAVKAADDGTFRTMVDGTIQYETEPPTEATEKLTEKATEEAKKKKPETKPKATEKATEATEATEAATTVTEATTPTEATQPTESETALQ